MYAIKQLDDSDDSMRTYSISVSLWRRLRLCRLSGESGTAEPRSRLPSSWLLRIFCRRSQKTFCPSTGFASFFHTLDSTNHRFIRTHYNLSIQTPHSFIVWCPRALVAKKCIHSNPFVGRRKPRLLLPHQAPTSPVSSLDTKPHPPPGVVLRAPHQPTSVASPLPVQACKLNHKGKSSLNLNYSPSRSGQRVS